MLWKNGFRHFVYLHHMRLRPSEQRFGGDFHRNFLYTYVRTRNTLKSPELLKNEIFVRKTYQGCVET